MIGIGRGATTIGAAHGARHRDDFIFVGKRLEETSLGGRNPFYPFRPFFWGVVGVDVVGGYSVASERRRGGGNGLGPGGPFLRHVAGRNLALHNRPHRLAGETVEDVQKPDLASDGHGRDGLSLALYGDQFG